MKMVQEHEQFDNLECDSIKFEDTEVKGFIAMAGYVTHKNFSLFDSCKGCYDLMCSDKVLEMENLSDDFLYLKDLYRGGLKWPSEQWATCVVEAAKVFKSLVNSEENELKFLSLICQRYTLHQLMKRIS